MVLLYGFRKWSTPFAPTQIVCPSHLSVSHLRPCSRQSLKSSWAQCLAAKPWSSLTSKSSSIMDKAVPSSSARTTSGLNLFCHHLTVAVLNPLTARLIWASLTRLLSSSTPTTGRPFSTLCLHPVSPVCTTPYYKGPGCIGLGGVKTTEPSGFVGAPWSLVFEDPSFFGYSSDKKDVVCDVELFWCGGWCKVQVFFGCSFLVLLRGFSFNMHFLFPLQLNPLLPPATSPEPNGPGTFFLWREPFALSEFLVWAPGLLVPEDKKGFPFLAAFEPHFTLLTTSSSSGNKAASMEKLPFLAASLLSCVGASSSAALSSSGALSSSLLFWGCFQ